MRRRRIDGAGTIYDLGRHRLELRRYDAGWSVRVDGLVVVHRYQSDAEAWTAGVAVADALDRFCAGELVA